MSAHVVRKRRTDGNWSGTVPPEPALLNPDGAPHASNSRSRPPLASGPRSCAVIRLPARMATAWLSTSYAREEACDPCLDRQSGQAAGHGDGRVAGQAKDA
jgi:hypothetical protein